MINNGFTKLICIFEFLCLASVVKYSYSEKIYILKKVINIFCQRLPIHDCVCFLSSGLPD